MEKGYSNGVCQVDLMIASIDGGATSVIDILIYAQHSVANSNDDEVSVDESQSSSKVCSNIFLLYGTLNICRRDRAIRC